MGLAVDLSVGFSVAPVMSLSMDLFVSISLGLPVTFLS
jgi:hypothetical protein